MLFQKLFYSHFIQKNNNIFGRIKLGKILKVRNKNNKGVIWEDFSMICFNKIQKNKLGFTLIELIVVIAILAILAAILVPAMITYISNATAGKEESNARSAYSSACSAYTKCVTDGETFDKLVYNSESDILVKTTREMLGDTAVNDLNILMSPEGLVCGVQIVENGCTLTYDVSKIGADGYDENGFKHSEASHNE